MDILNKIQKSLKAPKSQRNSFGNYNYRSCEDILEAVKPLLEEAILTLSDTIEQLGDRYYVKATATLTHNDKSISVSAYAREALDKKGMDDAQITGSASSYARKYALNGLFCIDDTKDDDYHNDGTREVAKKVATPKAPEPRVNAAGYPMTKPTATRVDTKASDPQIYKIRGMLTARGLKTADLVKAGLHSEATTMTSTQASEVIKWLETQPINDLPIIEQ